MGWTSAGTVKLSAVNVDADLAMGAHAITINAGGLIDGHDVSTLVSHTPKETNTKASNTVILEETTASGWLNNDAYDSSKKTLTLTSKNDKGGTLRTKISMENQTNGRVVNCRVYRNGVAVGTDNSDTYTALETKEYTEDIAGLWVTTDTIEAWAHVDGVSFYYKYVSLKVYGDYDLTALTAMSAAQDKTMQVVHKKENMQKFAGGEFPKDVFNFEGHYHRMTRDRNTRPKLDNKYKKLNIVCPDCDSLMEDEFKGHYGCRNCPYVAWDKPLVEK